MQTVQVSITLTPADVDRLFMWLRAAGFTSAATQAPPSATTSAPQPRTAPKLQAKASRPPKTQTATADDFLSVADLARLTGRTRHSIWGRISRGTLPHPTQERGRHKGWLRREVLNSD